ncbi:hypothetical protein DZK27_10205 [Rhodobacteraceae bacterium 63075]|nr:hypothetical protein DZK27_10205 [Rhodobacteraceae bacterium 63075]
MLASAPQIAPAQLSEMICDDKARLEQQLFGASGAVRQGRGMRGPDALLEVWIEPGSGDWTLVQSYPNGTSCLVAMGEHWEVISQQQEPS